MFIFFRSFFFSICLILSSIVYASDCQDLYHSLFVSLDRLAFSHHEMFTTVIQNNFMRGQLTEEARDRISLSATRFLYDKNPIINLALMERQQIVVDLNKNIRFIDLLNHQLATPQELINWVILKDSAENVLADLLDYMQVNNIELSRSRLEDFLSRLDFDTKNINPDEIIQQLNNAMEVLLRNNQLENVTTEFRETDRFIWYTLIAIASIAATRTVLSNEK